MSLIVEISSLLKESHSERVKMLFALAIAIISFAAPLYQKYEEKQLKKEK